METSKIHRAEILGEEAFQEGCTRVFYVHKSAVALTYNLQFGDPESLAIMKAWYRGWDKKNLENNLQKSL